jgi:hypothetical protein
MTVNLKIIMRCLPIQPLIKVRATIGGESVLRAFVEDECIYKQVFTNMYMHAFCFMKKYFFVMFLSILYHSLIIPYAHK